jgi:hypothetical protein
MEEEFYWQTFAYIYRFIHEKKLRGRGRGGTTSLKGIHE